VARDLLGFPYVARETLAAGIAFAGIAVLALVVAATSAPHLDGLGGSTPAPDTVVQVEPGTWIAYEPAQWLPAPE
jgi:hypothetical protein